MIGPRSEPRAVRIVHLLGGLRAVDDGVSPVAICIDRKFDYATFERPPFAQLYHALSGHRLEPIGVEFLTHQLHAEGLMPPTWRTYQAVSHFSDSKVEHDWGGVANVPEQRTEEIISASMRFQTYLRLLSFRVQALSEAYNLALHAKVGAAHAFGDDIKIGIYAGAYLTHIEAGIHAFLADAAGLRDLIGEAVWRLVLKRPDTDVTTLASFLKRTRADDHPLAREIQIAGADGGWLKVLTQLRNAVTHIAPLAQSQELHMMDLRQTPLGDIQAPYLHYPLLDSNGGLRIQSPLSTNQSRDEWVKGLEDYRSYVAGSEDALRYAGRVSHQLTALADQVRAAAGLRTEMKLFNQNNIIGQVVQRDMKDRNKRGAKPGGRKNPSDPST